MSQSPLCQLPVPPPGGCGCGPAPAPAVVPAAIDNAPGLTTIAYRIGTFTTFRQAMLDRAAAPGLLDLTPNPFAGWRPGTEGDYHTFLLELWAYLADILTFYQERIANEAYLGTASQRDSALRLVELIAYRPSPGAAAAGVASFTVASGQVVTIPAGFRIGSRAQPGKQAAVFETSAAITARAEHNAIPLSSVAPANQFATLANIGQIYAGLGGIGLVEAATDLFGSAGAIFATTLSFAIVPAREITAAPVTAALPVQDAASSSAPRSLARIASAVGLGQVGVQNLSATGLFTQGDITTLRFPFFNTTTRTIVFAGTNLRLNQGDYVLAVENGSTGSLFQLSTVSTDTSANTTTVTWREPAGKKYDTSSQPVAVYALRVVAAPFGSDAPVWKSLPPSLTHQPPDKFPDLWPDPPFPVEWDDPAQPNHYVPSSSQLDLDSVYDEARGTTQNPGWVALLVGGVDPANAQVFQVNQARPVTVTGYTLSKKVTRLTLAAGAPTASTYPIRETLVLTGSEPLPLQNDLPLPDLLQGGTLILAGLYPNLQDGQSIIVQGDLYSDTGPATTPSAEYHTIKGRPLQDASNNLTTVQIDKPLASQYSRASTSLLANLSPFTQGETVKNEQLGSSNGSSNQSFALKKKPLTYLPSTDPESESPVQSTIIVTVNGVSWEEQPSLVESDAGAQVYTLTQDDSGQTTVSFGDGVHGAVPPTGVGNIRARYRVGLGSSGNVPPDGVQQLLDSTPGLQQVANPQPTEGGADPESLARIAVNAPASVRAFNRAVSVADYAAIALTFPGIAKATASWVTAGTAQPYVQLTVATDDETDITASPLAVQLRNFLDPRRDVNIPLRISSFTPVYVNFAATVDIQERYPRQATFAAVEAALNPGINTDGSAGYFAFARLGFGESLHLSALYALLQSVPGVSDAFITRFNVAGATDAVANDILIGPTQIAVIGNDPAHPENGLLVLTLGSGGFADS